METIQNGIYSAGILPYTIIDSEIYVLLGRESYDKTYSDFGGKHDKLDNSIFDTACREFREESLFDKLSFEILNNKKIIYTESRTLKGNIYYMFLLKFQENEIYEIIDNFMQNITDPNNLNKEKDNLIIMKLDDILSQIIKTTQKTIKYRKVFNNTIYLHHNFLKDFIKFQDSLS